MTAWLGTAWGLGSAISWACANVAIQVAARRVGSWSALVWAQLIGGLVAVVAAWWIDGPLRMPSAAAAGLVVGGGVASAAAYGGLFEALRRGQVAMVSPIISAWSAISVAIVVARGERPGTLVWLGVLLVVAGNVTVARSAARDESSSTPGAAIACAVLAACGFGVTVPLLDLAGREIGRLWAIPMVWSVELALGVPILLYLGLLKRPRGAGELGILSLAALLEVGGFIALSVGLSVATVSVVSPVSSLSTTGSVALGLILLRERVARSALAGALLASAGVVLINL